MINSHLSSGGEEPGVIEREFYRRRKLTRYFNRRKFLHDCIEEKVLPKSAPKQLQNEATPFSNAARTYLEDEGHKLSLKMYEIIDLKKNVNLTPNMQRILMTESKKQTENLQRKLMSPCQTSAWKDVGKAENVVNLSNKILTKNESEALSLGLKFDSGVDNKTYADYVLKNYRWTDSDMEKGFIQGVLACCTALSKEQPSALPRRYRTALNELGRNSDIVITRSDKGGGVVVMNKIDYNEKMMDLLNDTTTYEKKYNGYSATESENFNKNARNLLKKSPRGKRLLHLLEEHPRPPKMKGLPKTHKPAIPMRPITSGIGSAPHKLAKRLARPLSSTLGTISGAHLRNSTDLINKLKSVDYHNKKMASFDVKSLFTNVPVEGAMQAVTRALENVEDDELPVPKEEYIQLVSLCVRFGAFTFGDEEYVQHRGLAMGSPLSAVMACLFMETVEADSYSRIIGRGSTWLRYVDDVIVIIPNNTNIDNKLRMLNKVNKDIQFTVEEENNGKLPFLDTVVWRGDEGVKFSVYRKPTNKDDFIHYLSAHSDRTKSGVVIGFFLRAYRICSSGFIEEEIDYIKSAFRKLGYPEGYLIKLRNKAVKIVNKSKKEKENGNDVNERYLCIPNSDKASIITECLSKAGLKVATAGGIKIGDMCKDKQTKVTNENSVIYRIPCKGCDKVYIGETSRGLKKRISEHKNDVLKHNVSNSLVVHIDNYGHLPDWNAATEVKTGLEKNMRKAIEAAIIHTNNVNNHREGFHKWALPAAKLALNPG